MYMMKELKQYKIDVMKIINHSEKSRCNDNKNI